MSQTTNLLQNLEHLTQQKLGLYWESNAIERDAALVAVFLFALSWRLGGQKLTTTAPAPLRF